MWEILIAFGIAGCLAAGALVNAFVPWEILLVVSVWITGAGLLISLPLGVMYHLHLYRYLSPDLPPRWLWNPVALNRRLKPEQWRRTRLWFYSGAAGFVIAMIGCAGMALAALRAA